MLDAIRFAIAALSVIAALMGAVNNPDALDGSVDCLRSSVSFSKRRKICQNFAVDNLIGLTTPCDNVCETYVYMFVGGK